MNTLPKALVPLTFSAYAVVAIAAPASAAPVLVTSALHYDVSPALRSLPKLNRTTAITHHEAEPVLPLPLPVGFKPPGEPDPALQTTYSAGPRVPRLSRLSTLAAALPPIDVAFPGIAATGFTPPDTNGTVGTTQYMQTVNSSLAVFNKSTGTTVSGPTAIKELWAGFGGSCEELDDGDPIVVFDKIAKRWVVSQFALGTHLNPEVPPDLECVAVSTSSDATGTYYRYSFPYPTMNGTPVDTNDYPKMGVWPDGYYITFNMFGPPGNAELLGSVACAYDRNAMLNGQSATQQCVEFNYPIWGLLPSDFDGTAVPPAGTPNYLVNFSASALNVWSFHVDFANSANTTLTGPTAVPIAAFTPMCSADGGQVCIPQPQTTQQLDALGDRLMNRLAYRYIPPFNPGDIGTRGMLLVNQSVTVGSAGGVRWYQVFIQNGSPRLAQQGTFAPADSNFRWSGSIASDSALDIALGYSESSASTYPMIAYTGRFPNDPVGQMGQEVPIANGGGSQTGSPRWGDYSSMQVDPVDDCTFWYTQEYYPSTSQNSWATQIAKFKFPLCPQPFLDLDYNPIKAYNATFTAPAGAFYVASSHGWTVPGRLAMNFTINGAPIPLTLHIVHVEASARGHVMYAPVTISVNGTPLVRDYDIRQHNGGSLFWRGDDFQIPASAVRTGSNVITFDGSPGYWVEAIRISAASS